MSEKPSGRYVPISMETVIAIYERYSDGDPTLRAIARIILNNGTAGIDDTLSQILTLGMTLDRRIALVRERHAAVERADAHSDSLVSMKAMILASSAVILWLTKGPDEAKSRVQATVMAAGLCATISGEVCLVCQKTHKADTGGCTPQVVGDHGD